MAAPDIQPTLNLVIAPDVTNPWPAAVHIHSPQELLVMNESFLGAHPDAAYPSAREPFLTQKTLLGLPFAVAGMWQFKLQPAKSGTDKNGLPYFIDERQVAQLRVCLLDVSGEPAVWSYRPARLATVSGAYLLNQLRDLRENDLVGAGIFTFGRNPKMSPYKNPQTQRAEYPIMLKRWEPGKDVPGEAQQVAQLEDMDPNNPPL